MMKKRVTNALSQL